VKALITGAGGQLGRALAETAPAGVKLVALDSATLDITSCEAAAAAVRDHRPALILNAAGYTAVDRAEQERDRAFAVNADGAAHLAQAARDNGARLIHVSTDYVFDGDRSRPWRPDDPTAPLGVYGASKLEGERRVVALDPRALIVRTAWVYGAHGHNFVNTMLRLMRNSDEIRVVSDQVGTPTWSKSLARALWAAADKPALAGIYHWTDAGVASWYDFAVAIEEEALALGLLMRAVPIRPIATADYPTPARRPAYSVLDKTSAISDFGVTPPHWRAALRDMLKELPHA
jgi:dTDP-4-dehydrorhamnose reductase